MPEVCRALVDRGCTGTVRADIVVQLGRGTLNKKRIEIPDVEARAKGLSLYSPNLLEALFSEGRE